MMSEPYVRLVEENGLWRAYFGYQVFLRSSDEWLKMRWGFNAGALLDEALDRQKLFIETLAVTQSEFYKNTQPDYTLALRVIKKAEGGLCLALLGRVNALNKEDALRNGQSHARELHSIFPQDYILKAAENIHELDELSGRDLLGTASKIAHLQRAYVPVDLTDGRKVATGLWSSSQRSGEQVWRILSAAPVSVLLNIQIQPTFFYEGERLALLEMKKKLAAPGHSNALISAHTPWAENYIKRRLSPWKKYFLLQIHVAAAGVLDETLIRPIGAAFTRDTGEGTNPGYQIKWAGAQPEVRGWGADILSLRMISASRNDDIADADEVYSVFRLPYMNEGGLPGANFIPSPDQIPSTPTEVWRKND